MIRLNQTRSYVTGTTERRVGSIRLQSGSYTVSGIIGCQGAVSTATVYVREEDDATNLLTFSSAAEPARLASQTLTLDAEAVIEFYAVNSSNSTGAAYVADIQISVAPLQLWANNISVRLASPVSDSATSIVLASGAGDQIGLSPTGGQFFLVSLVSGTSLEIVRCTARSSDTLTVTRAQEGTSARAWQVSGTNVVVANTSATLTRLQAYL